MHLKQVIKDIELHKTPPTAAVFPNFGRDPSIHYPECMTVKIPAEGLITLGEKIVRGLTYHFAHRFIEDEKEEIGVHFVHDRNVTEVAELVKRFGQAFHKGPGIAVARAVTQDGSNAALFIIEIWGRLKIYASLLPREEIAG